MKLEIIIGGTLQEKPFFLNFLLSHSLLYTINLSFTFITMKFCPLCFKLLLIQSSTTGNRLICKLCRYYYPLTKQQKTVVKYAKQQKLQVVEQDQQMKEMPITQTMCPKCGCNKAYYQQRQTRSADEAATLFFTCVQCKHKWNEN